MLGCFSVVIGMIDRAINARLNVCDHSVEMMLGVLMLEHLFLYIILSYD
jgi:hypothetical protein